MENVCVQGGGRAYLDGDQVRAALGWEKMSMSIDPIA